MLSEGKARVSCALALRSERSRSDGHFRGAQGIKGEGRVTLPLSLKAAEGSERNAFDSDLVLDFEAGSAFDLTQKNQTPPQLPPKDDIPPNSA